MSPRLTVYVSLLALFFATPAQSQYAIDGLERLTGLRIQPRNELAACYGTTRDTRTCEPMSGPFRWQKVRNLSSQAVHITLGADADSALVKQVANAYLGAGYANGLPDQQCIDTTVSVEQKFGKNWKAEPVPTTSIAQLVEETVVRVAKAKFDIVAKATSLTNKASLRAAFESSLRVAIKANTSRKTDIKWITTYVNVDATSLASIPATAACRTFASARRGSLVVGVAGFVIIGNAGTGNYVSESMFTRAASVALAGDATAATQSAVASAAADWSNETNSRISTDMSSAVSKPTFYPMWVEFVNIP